MCGVNLLADFYNILSKWKSYLSHLLKICVVNDVRQAEVLMAELLILPHRFFKVESFVRKSKRYESSDIDQTGRIGLREIGWGGMDWINLADDRDQW
jgi:hypothetical protein